MAGDSVLIEGGTIVTMNSAMDVVADGVLLAEQGRIRYVGPRSGLEMIPPGTEVIDATEHLVLPGLVNAHTHLPMSLFRGLADDLPLETWLEEHMFPAEAEFITPENVELGVRLSLAEMLLSGTTTCADGYFLESTALQVAETLGIRGVFAQGIVDFPAPGVPDPAQNLAVVRDFLVAHASGTQRRPAVFAHSPYTCSERTLRGAKALAEEFGVMFFLHVAETAWEVTQSREQHHGLTPIRYLDAIGVLDAHTVLVHAVHVDEQEQDIIAASGAGVCICTESNMKLAAGVAPLRGYLARGIPVGLGTDGCASNNDLDLLLDMRSTALVHKLTSLDPAFPHADEVLSLATRGGAMVLGLDHEIGSLEAGKLADVVGLDVSGPNATPLYNPYSHLAYSASGADVAFVLCSGNIMVRNGELADWDVSGVLHDVRRLSGSIGRFGK